MVDLIQDLRYALRQMRKHPGFTAVVAITLALGIGANTCIFSVIEAAVLRPLPYRDSKRLVLLADSQDPEDGGVLYQDFEAIKASNRTLEVVAVYYRDSGFSRVTLGGTGEPESVQGAFVSASFFPLMGVQPILGRPFTTEEEARGDHVIMLSQGLWVRRFGAASDAIGKTLQVDGLSFQIIGVMPAKFQFPARDQLFWAPIATNRYWGDPALSNLNLRRSPGFYQRWQAIGRLKPGVRIGQAQADVETIFSRCRLVDNNPNRGNSIDLLPLRTNLRGNAPLALGVLSAAVIFVLLIACSNAANLLLARGVVRETEIAIRAALGASRGHLIRQLFTESLVLALLSGLLGVLIVPSGIRALVALAPADIPGIHDAGLHGGVLGFALVISLLAAVLFGLAPAWKLSRAAAPPGAGGKRLTQNTGPRHIQGFLVIAEFASATILLTGAGLLIRSFLAVEAVDTGFQAAHVLTMNMNLPGATPARANGMYDEVLERVRAIPGVESVGAVDSFFDSGKISNLGLRSVEGRLPEPRERWTPLRWASVRGGFFQAMGVSLLHGRYFSPQDGPNSPLVAIVDESMALRYWPDEDTIGKRFKGQDTRGQSDDWLTVVGVVRDMHLGGLERRPIPHVYEPYTQAIDGHQTRDLVIRVAGFAKPLATSIRAVVREIDPHAILSPATALEEQLSDQLSPRRFVTVLLGAFSAIALLLAAVGIYSVFHFAVAQRTREIGIRIALGARPLEVVKPVLLEGAKLSMTGLMIGAAGAIVMTQFMNSLVFGIAATDPMTFAGAAILLLTVALLACYLPARRAAKVDPMVALRYE